jgi:hypothetical protein
MTSLVFRNGRATWHKGYSSASSKSSSSNSKVDQWQWQVTLIVIVHNKFMFCYKTNFMVVLILSNSFNCQTYLELVLVQ